METLYKELKQYFDVDEFSVQKASLAFLRVPKSQLVSLLTHMKDIRGYSHLVMVTCVDYLEQDSFLLTYLLHNYSTHCDLGIQVSISRQNPVMDGIHHLWEQGRVYQRELFEMFGIDFPGSPDVHEPMILEGWQGPPPMRRDFDTKAYSEATYSHRPRDHKEPEEYMKQQLYPED
ncbi:hypothetical protein MASR1M36_03240 [Candidatus Cloacimonadaceae bacterium]